MRLTGSAALFAVCIVLLSCQSKAGLRLASSIAFVVESDPGRPLGGVSIYADGKRLGETNSSGRLRADVEAGAGQELRIEHECPEGHEGPGTAKLVRLRTFERVGSSAPGGLQVTLRCRPEWRRAVVVIHAPGGADLPVLLNGHSVATTNDAGIAHFSNLARPGTDFLIELDTSRAPRLRPRRPSHVRSLADADEIFVIRQRFEHRREWRRKGSQRARITKIE